MRKLILIICLIFSGSIFAYDFNKIIFFGDSLSDNGNLYKTFLKIIPKSPPYYQGRFSNGPVWAEILAQSMQIDYEDYAVGGATALFHWPQIQFVSPELLEYEVNKYLAQTVGQDKSQNLYSFWIGSNDYLYGLEKKADQFTNDVVNKEMSMIDLLVASGAKNFLVLNLPDISRVPEAQGDPVLQVRYHELIVSNNDKLKNALVQLKSDHPEVNIYFIDVYSFLNGAIDHPDQYNQLFNVNITDVSDSCWPGKYTLQPKSLEKSVYQDVVKELSTMSTKLDAKVLTNDIIYSPELAYVYQVGKSYENGMQPCANPDQYLFWDHVHPTTTVHQVLSQIVLKTLQSQPTY